MSDEKHIHLTIKSIASALSVILLLIIGGSLTMSLIEATFSIGERFGYFYYWVVMMGTAIMLVCIPNGMMIIHGLKSFSQVNQYNCYFQLVAALVLFKTGPIWFYISLSNVAIPLLCFILLRGKAYKNFVEFYYVLQSNRRQERRRLKELTKHR